jgi:hypothetical protein
MMIAKKRSAPSRPKRGHIFELRTGQNGLFLRSPACYFPGRTRAYQLRTLGERFILMCNLRPFLLVAAGLFAPLAHADVAKKIADVEIKIDDGLIKKDAGIRTMFLIVYDADSSMPMPYGALKVDLTADAKGVFYKGALTSQNITVMGGGDVPKNLRIKARLDKDGSAGRDEPGDLVGIADKVSPGSKVNITINKAI